MWCKVVRSAGVGQDHQCQPRNAPGLKRIFAADPFCDLIEQIHGTFVLRPLKPGKLVCQKVRFGKRSVETEPAGMPFFGNAPQLMILAGQKIEDVVFLHLKMFAVKHDFPDAGGAPHKLYEVIFLLRSEIDFFLVRILFPIEDT